MVDIVLSTTFQMLYLNFKIIRCYRKKYHWIPDCHKVLSDDANDAEDIVAGFSDSHGPNGK